MARRKTLSLSEAVAALRAEGYRVEFRGGDPLTYEVSRNDASALRRASEIQAWATTGSDPYHWQPLTGTVSKLGAQFVGTARE